MTDEPLPDLSILPHGTRHDGWTLERQERFLAHLAMLGGVAAAARAVGKSKQSAYKLRERSPVFADAWNKAQAEGRDRAYDRALDRGLNGYVTPVYRRGRIVGHRHRFDNRLLFAACYGRDAADRGQG